MAERLTFDLIDVSHGRNPGCVPVLSVLFGCDVHGARVEIRVNLDVHTPETQIFDSARRKLAMALDTLRDVGALPADDRPPTHNRSWD